MKKLDNILFDPYSRKFWANVNGSLVRINDSNDLIDVYTKAEVDGLVADAGKVKSVSVNSGELAYPDAQGNVNISVETGSKGDDGITPHIDVVTGHWYIGDEDTGISARGLQGNSGYTGAVGELEVVNNLTDGGEEKALSAEMGKQLAMGILAGKGNYAAADYLASKNPAVVFPWLLDDIDTDDNHVKKMIWHIGNQQFIDAIGSTIEGDTYVMTSETNPAMMAICYANGFAASPDHITKREAQAATGSAGQFNQSGVTHIDLRYFTGLVTIISQRLGNISGKKLTLPAKPNPMSVNSALGAAYSDFTVIIPPEVTRLDTYFINNTTSGKNAKVICESETPFAIEQSRPKWFNDMPIEEVTMYVPSSAVTAYEEHSVFGKYEILPIEDYTE